MILYRPQRGGYSESMAEIHQFKNWQEFLLYISKWWNENNPLDMIGDLFDDIEVKEYGEGTDPRNGWNTHIVLVKGTAIGFTNGPI